MANSSASSLGAFPPPPGVVPDFEAPRHEAIRGYFMILMIVCYISTLVFCIVRGYVKASRFEMLADDCKFGFNAHALRSKQSKLK